jgi:hypothetical protein
MSEKRKFEIVVDLSKLDEHLAEQAKSKSNTFFIMQRVAARLVRTKAPELWEYMRTTLKAMRGETNKKRYEYDL